MTTWATNPFRQKALKARSAASRSRGSAHDKAMEQSFPLGGGFGRKGGARRLESTISRATAAIEAESRAKWLEAQANAFDAGEINAQGRSMDASAWERSDKRQSAKERRETRIATARAAIEGKARHEVSAEVWADAHGYLAGSARALVISEHPKADE